MVIIQRGLLTINKNSNLVLADFTLDKSCGIIHAEIIAKPLVAKTKESNDKKGRCLTEN